MVKSHYMSRKIFRWFICYVPIRDITDKATEFVLLLYHSVYGMFSSALKFYFAHTVLYEIIILILANIYTMKIQSWSRQVSLLYLASPGLKLSVWTDLPTKESHQNDS